MQLTIKDNTKNPLLSRSEIKATLTFEGATPSNSDVQAEIAKQTSCKLELVVVKGIHTDFGKQQAQVDVLCYDDMKAREQFEMLTKHEKKRREEEAKKRAEEEAARKEAEEKAKQEAEAAKAAEQEKADEPANEESSEEKPAEESDA